MTTYYNVQLSQEQIDVLISLAELVVDRAPATFADWSKANPKSYDTVATAEEVLRKLSTAPVDFSHWPSADGLVAVTEMTHLHIRNVLRMLERRIEEADEQCIDAASFAASCRGEMATYYASHEMDDTVTRASMYIAAARKWIEVFEGELARREKAGGSYVR